MSKHTLGPWELTGGTFLYALNSYGTNIFWANVYAGSQGGYRSDSTRTEEIEANARLMAAAPDLLEALTRLVGWAEIQYGATTCAYSGDHPIAMAVHAIAKARGES